jgi:hypothetical protein
VEVIVGNRARTAAAVYIVALALCIVGAAVVVRTRETGSICLVLSAFV